MITYLGIIGALILEACLIGIYCRYTKQQFKETLKNKQCRNCKHLENCCGDWKKKNADGACEIYSPKQAEPKEVTKIAKFYTWNPLTKRWDEEQQDKVSFEEINKKIDETNVRLNKFMEKHEEDIKKLIDDSIFDRDITQEDIEQLNKLLGGEE